MRHKSPVWDTTLWEGAIWDAPRQVWCRMLAGVVWLLLGAGFWVLLAAFWGGLPVAIVFWALGAVPVAFLTFRWLESQGGFRTAAAQVLLVSCVALTASAVVLVGPLADWDHLLPYVVVWFPVGLSLLGALLGFLGRRRNPTAFA